MRLAFYTACLCALISCAKSNETVTTQQQRGWLGTDPAQMDAAKPEPEANIMPGTYLAAGRLHEMQGALPKAVEQYQLALAGDPQNVGAMNRLAMVYSRMARFDEAQRTLERAVRIKPDSALLRNNLGYAFICTKNWPAAESEFREALRLDPGLHRARINLGLAIARQDRISEALTEFRGALPEADALYNLGLVLRGMQRYQEAADAFELVLERDSQFVAARQQLEELAPRLKAAASITVVDTPRVAVATQPAPAAPVTPGETPAAPVTQPAVEAPAPVAAAPEDDASYASVDDSYDATFVNDAAPVDSAERVDVIAHDAQEDNAPLAAADEEPQVAIEPAVAVQTNDQPEAATQTPEPAADVQLADAPVEPTPAAAVDETAEAAAAVNTAPEDVREWTVVAEVPEENEPAEPAQPAEQNPDEVAAQMASMQTAAPVAPEPATAVAISPEFTADLVPLVHSIATEAGDAAADDLTIGISTADCRTQSVQIAELGITPAQERTLAVAASIMREAAVPVSPRTNAPAAEVEPIDSAFADAYAVEGIDPDPGAWARQQQLTAQQNALNADANEAPAATVMLATARPQFVAPPAPEQGAPAGESETIDAQPEVFTIPAKFATYQPQDAAPNALLPIDDSNYFHFLLEGVEPQLN